MPFTGEPTVEPQFDIEVAPMDDVEAVMIERERGADIRAWTDGADVLLLAT